MNAAEADRAFRRDVLLRTELEHIEQRQGLGTTRPPFHAIRAGDTYVERPNVRGMASVFGPPIVIGAAAGAWTRSWRTAGLSFALSCVVQLGLVHLFGNRGIRGVFVTRERVEAPT